jgi:hypothetical protein
MLANLTARILPPEPVALAPAQQPWSNKQDLRNLLILWVIALATRVPFLGIGEPDSALFVIGVKQWLSGGPQAPIIYSGAVCGGYYAAVIAMVRHFHLAEENCAALMSAASAIAGLGILAIGYLLGRRFVGSQNALKAMLLFSLSPGLWWSTIQPHPEAASLCFSLLGIWSFVRFLESECGWGAFLASAMSFGIAISLKNDAVLLLPALYGFAFVKGGRWRNFIAASGAAGLAVIISLLLGRLAVGPSYASVRGTASAVGVYFDIPSLLEFVKQVMPIGFGFGMVTFVAIVLVTPRVLLRSPDRRRWLIILGSWCLSGYLFWMFIRGNNIRHVMGFGIPIFWLAATRLRMPQVFACLLLSILIPANSNMLMFPSPNLSGDIRLFHDKEAEVTRLSKQLLQASSCFIGSYSNDYILEQLLEYGGRINATANSHLSAVLPGEIDVTMPNNILVKLLKVSPSNKSVQLGACRSLEYAPNGRKTRLLGTEWRLPIF